jgi:hypothetical protein
MSLGRFSQAAQCFLQPGGETNLKLCDVDLRIVLHVQIQRKLLRAQLVFSVLRGLAQAPAVSPPPSSGKTPRPASRLSPTPLPLSSIEYRSVPPTCEPTRAPTPVSARVAARKVRSPYACCVSLFYCLSGSNTGSIFFPALCSRVLGSKF